MSKTTSMLRKKINTAEDLWSVVRTMKAVAASNIGQYEKSVKALAEYYRSVELGLGVSLREGLQVKTFKRRSGQTDSIDAVVFGSDQGLVGQFNDIVSEYALKTLTESSDKVRVWAVGERVKARLSDYGLHVVDSFKLPASIQGIASLVGEILVERESHADLIESSKFYLFYNQPQAAEVYSPFVQTLLPFDKKWLRNLREEPWPSGRSVQVIGDKTVALRALINEYLFISIFRACAESLASENASRLAAMQRAEKNIDELLKDLNQKYHRLRKTGIDEELFDIIAAFDSHI